MRFFAAYDSFLDRKLARSGNPNRSKIFNKYIRLHLDVILVDLGTFVVLQNLDTNLQPFFVKASWYSRDLFGMSRQLLGIHELLLRIP